jgi:hypothetical protein
MEIATPLINSIKKSAVPLVDKTTSARASQNYSRLLDGTIYTSYKRLIYV